MPPGEALKNPFTHLEIKLVTSCHCVFFFSHICGNLTVFGFLGKRAYLFGYLSLATKEVNAPFFRAQQDDILVLNPAQQF